MADRESASNSPEELAGPRYALGQRFNRGGMGGLWYAKESATGRTIALKRILGRPDAESFRRFLNEARITARLEHPNIVPVHGLGTDAENQPFYTMKLVQGTDLAGVLKKLASGDKETISAYPLAQLLIIFQKICDAVAFAHSRNVIHRDLKPANIMIGPFGEVLVMDWGLAKDLAPSKSGIRIDLPSNPADSPDSSPGENAPTLAESAGLLTDEQPTVIRPQTLPPVEEVTLPLPPEAEEDPGVTLPGKAYGSPHYMAPEQARGDVHLHDVRTDIYALGAILYQIVSLRYPVSGQTAAEVIARVSEGDLDPITPNVVSNEKNEVPPVSRRKKLAHVALRHLPGGIIPESLIAVILRSMAFKPEKRYQTVIDLQKEITAYQNGFATGAEQAGLGKHILLALRRHRREATVAAAALLVLLIIAVASFIRIRGERDRANDARDIASRRETEARAAQIKAKAAQNEAEMQRIKAEKTNADLIAQRSVTEHANSRSDLQAAQRLFESQRPAESVAYLCRALQHDPSNLGALGDLLARLTDLPWLYPAAVTIRLPEEIGDITFGPDSLTFAVGVYNNGARETPCIWHIYKIKPGEPQQIVEIGQISTNDYLRFSSDGKLLVELHRNEEKDSGLLTGRVWDAGTVHLRKNQKPPPIFIPPANYHTQTKGKVIRVVDATGKAFGNAITVGLSMESAYCSRDGRYVVAQTNVEDLSSMWMWRLGMDAEDPNRELFTEPTSVNSVRFSPGSHLVALDLQEYQDGPPTTSLYRLLGDDKPLRQQIEFFADARVADFSPDGRYAIVGHAHGQVQLWTVADPAQTIAKREDWLYAGSFIHNNDSPVTKSVGEKSLNAASLHKLGLPIPSNANDPLGWISPSKRHAVIQGEKNWEIWDLTSRQHRTLQFPLFVLKDFKFSPNETAIAFEQGTAELGKDEPAIHVVNLDTGEDLTAPNGEEGRASIAFSREGRFLTWDYEDETQVYQLEGFRRVTSYQSNIHDPLWKNEEILKLTPSPELLAAATALVGKRLSEEGVMESVPPEEWLRLRKDCPREASTITQRVVRWLLKWPDERTKDAF